MALQKKRSAFGSTTSTALMAIILAGFVILALYLAIFRTPTLDTAMRQTLARADTVRSYVQEVETEIQFPERHLKVAGFYYVNEPESTYASFATTTLTLSNPSSIGQNHEFSLDNISIGTDVYTKVETASDALRDSIPETSGWKYFNALEIPPEFKNIAIPGATLDNLLLFSENGRYLTFVEKLGTETVKGEELSRYQFTLSGDAPEAPLGPLSALLTRITNDGIVDVWIDETAQEIRYARFSNEIYISTTTIHTHTPPPIAAPVQSDQ